MRLFVHKKHKNDITQAFLKECVSYNPETGVFTWKERPEHHFKTPHAHKVFLARNSGKPAGYTSKIGYRTIRIDGKLYLAHRLAWLYENGVMPKGDIDHANHDKSDNRIGNLRPVSHAENGRNLRKKKNNTSGFNGVWWFADRGKWIAEIMIEGKKKHLGVFHCKLDAIAARIRANRKFGFHENHGA